MHITKNGNYAFPNQSYPSSTVIVPETGGATIVATILDVVIADAVFTPNSQYVFNHGAGAPIVLTVTGYTVPFEIGFYGMR